MNLDAELTIPVFALERKLLTAYAKNEGVPVEAYCRKVLNDHIRTVVGLPLSPGLERTSDD